METKEKEMKKIMLEDLFFKFDYDEDDDIYELMQKLEQYDWVTFYIHSRPVDFHRAEIAECVISKAEYYDGDYEEVINKYTVYQKVAEYLYQKYSHQLLKIIENQTSM